MKKALNNQIKSAEYSRTIHRHVPESGTSPHDLRLSEYWVNVAGMLKPGDRIEVEPEGRKWYAELYVMGNKDKKVSVRMICFIDFSLPEMELDYQEPAPVASINEARDKFLASGKREASAEGYEGEYRIEFRKMTKWRVVRVSDKEVIKAGFETQDEAKEWLAKYRSGDTEAKAA